MSELEFPHPDVRVDGLVRLGEGRAAEVFRWGDGAAVKLMRRPDSRRFVIVEAAAMQAAEATGIPMAKFIGTIEIDRRPGIVIQLADGPDQLTLLGRKPWKVWSVGCALGRLHAQLHSSPVGVELRSLKDAVSASIEASALVPEDVRSIALAALERLPDGDFVCHGDFHPGNVIETSDGPKVIDWANAVRGDRLADVARTTILFSGKDVGANPPLLLRLMNRLGRAVVWSGYSRTYRRLRPYGQAAVDAWIPVIAAQRLTDDIPGEREHLLRLVRDHGGEGAQS